MLITQTIEANVGFKFFSVIGATIKTTPPIMHKTAITENHFQILLIGFSASSMVLILVKTPFLFATGFVGWLFCDSMRIVFGSNSNQS